MAETDGAYEVTVDLPGMNPKEVKIEYHDGSLVIAGERKEEKESKEKTFHRVERYVGSFRRVIAFPGVEESKIDANYKEGVLTIILPKSERKNAKQIKVNS